MAVHEAPDFDRWLKAEYLKPAVDMAGVKRCIVGRGDGKAVTVSFFPSSEYPAVRRFYSNNVPLDVQYVDAKIFRVPSASKGRYKSVEVSETNLGALDLSGRGLMVGSHGISVSYGLWEREFTSMSSDNEHATLNVKASAAGSLLGLQIRNTNIRDISYFYFEKG